MSKESYWKDKYYEVLKWGTKRDRVTIKVTNLCNEAKADLKDVDPDVIIELLRED